MTIHTKLPRSGEWCLVDVLESNENMVVACIIIHECVHRMTTYLFLEQCYERQRKVVFLCASIQLPIINIHHQLPKTIGKIQFVISTSLMNPSFNNLSNCALTNKCNCGFILLSFCLIGQASGIKGMQCSTISQRCGNTQTLKFPVWRVLVPNPGNSEWPQYRPGILWSVGGWNLSGSSCFPFSSWFAGNPKFWLFRIPSISGNSSPGFGS